MTVLSKQSGEEYLKKNYTERMERTKRPVSPHVTIYDFPVVALSSIANRITGTALSIGIGGLCAAELISTGSAVGIMQEVSASSLAPLAKFSVAFPLSFHYGGGIRHVYWDNVPEKLTNEDVEKSSYILGAVSIVISVGAMFI